MSPAATRCSACDFANPAGMRFCGGCGAPLATALRAGQAAAAATEFEKALQIARAIGYPTLTWQAAPRLAEAHAAAGNAADAFAAAPEPELRKTLAAWTRVVALDETFERLRRG